MGLDYEIHLYFPQEKVWDVLQSVAAIAQPVGTTTVVLPNREIVLPFTSGFKNETIILDNSIKSIGFDTSLYFNSDALIEADLAKSTLPEETKQLQRDTKGRIAIGYIYLTVYPDLRDAGYQVNFKPGICLFEFAAATTNMSLLFDQSKSIKRAFKRLLKQHKGLLGYFHDSNYYHLTSYDFWSHLPCYYFWPPDISRAEARSRCLIELD